MSKRKTHAQYEQELFEREIDYWPIESYINNSTKILHECLKGHQWEVSPGSILQGYGCPKCSSNRRKTPDEYAADLLAKNIIYKPTESYVNSKTPILHQCPIENHPSWYISPNDILKGHGCPTCASNQKKTHEEYISELLDKGISYTPVEYYIGAHFKILHKCLDESHPEWAVTPNNILKGYGCPSCSKTGFDPAKAGKLYFLSFIEDNETFFKIGITNLNARKRHLADWEYLKMELLWEVHFESGSEARKAERQFLVDNKEFLLNTKALRSGNTETFSIFINPPEYLNGRIEQFSRTPEVS